MCCWFSRTSNCASLVILQLKKRRPVNFSHSPALGAIACPTKHVQWALNFGQKWHESFIYVNQFKLISCSPLLILKNELFTPLFMIASHLNRMQIMAKKPKRWNILESYTVAPLYLNIDWVGEIEDTKYFEILYGGALTRDFLIS